MRLRRQTFPIATLAMVGILGVAPAAIAEHGKPPHSETEGKGNKHVGEAPRGEPSARHEMNPGKGQERPSPSALASAPIPEAAASAGPGPHHAPARRERHREAVRELRTRYGADTLRLPEVRAELEHHAWRMAKLSRMRKLVAEKKNEKLETRIDRLEKKEVLRHEQAMARLSTAPHTVPSSSSAVAPANSGGVR